MRGEGEWDLSKICPKLENYAKGKNLKVGVISTIFIVRFQYLLLTWSYPSRIISFIFIASYIIEFFFKTISNKEFDIIIYLVEFRRS